MERLLSKKQAIISVSEDVEKSEPSNTVTGNVNRCSQLIKIIWKGLKKLGELPYDPATLLDIYPKNMKTVIQKDICTPMFTAASFIITKIRNYLNAYRHGDKKDLVSVQNTARPLKKIKSYHVQQIHGP